MPYWSSSRVGAVPSGTAPTKKRSQRRGITMEDLKKQTAMRLAHEQGRTEDTNFPAAPVKFTPPGDCSEMGANPKLPHGLTVQELKEMTKARLQAEAAEKVDFCDPMVPTAVPPVPSQPSIRNHGPSNLSTGSGSLRSVSNAPPGTGPPPGYGPPSHFVEMPHQHLDALENASVSTAASDYPDSVYSLNGSREEAIPFARSASYPNNYSGDNSLPETPYGYEVPNRRRAATLSPRPAMAAYTDWRRPIPPTRTRSALVPQQLHYDNRARTNSAVSLPAFSNTDEEFGRFSTRIRSVREDAPWVSDVFRGSSGVTDVSLQSRTSSDLACLNDSLVQENDRGRPWGEPFFCGQDLSDDLASILKLSGAEEK